MYDKGLVKDIVYTISTDDNTNYTRGDAVTLLYNSLKKSRKDGKKTVCEVLIDKKVTNIATAKKYDLIKFDESKTVIKSVKSVDVDTVEVTMYEPVIVDAKNIELYANNKLMKVKDFETKNTILIINVEEELYDERQFKIVIKKLYDEDDNLTEGLEKSFDGIERPEIQSTLFKISKIKPITSEMLEIYFTQPIDDKAEQVLLYDVYRNGALYFEGSYKTLEIKMNTTV